MVCCLVWVTGGGYGLRRADEGGGLRWLGGKLVFGCVANQRDLIKVILPGLPTTFLAPGQCAVLLREGRFIYYLLCANCTRLDPWGTQAVDASLCERCGIPSIIVSTVITADCLSSLAACSHSIGCGLDQLKWTEVAKILEQVFTGTGITITIYSLPWTAASMN
uniref:Uncharacterized protein n=1 Tax=Acanthochromis polyacanthus TaxID=80966 RepID=A0A3Q1EZA5_9TELE